jgi:diacylglycerol kinase (ATP)
MPEHFKTFCVVNPSSAAGATGRAWPKIREQIAAAIEDFDWALTEQIGHATWLTREALRRGFEQVVSVGGDGTNNEVISGFFDETGTSLNSNAVFAQVARGTGSDLRRTFGFDRRAETYVEKLKGRQTWPVDVGRMSFRDHDGNAAVRHFINIVSFGIGGVVCRTVNRSSKRLGGRLSFMLATFKALRNYRNQTVRLTVDGGEPRTLRVNNIAIANGQFHGGGMRVAPDARIDDGLFDIVIFGDLTLWDVIKGNRRIYRGAHIGMPKVEHLRGSNVVAESDETMLLEVEGEQPGALGATFECLPAAVRMKVQQPHAI